MNELTVCVASVHRQEKATIQAGGHEAGTKERRKKVNVSEPPLWLEVESMIADGGSDERLKVAAAAALPALAALSVPPDPLQEELDVALDDKYVAAEVAFQRAATLKQKRTRRSWSWATRAIRSSSTRHRLAPSSV